jgi:diguanylate cyclase (GGDEF)-like protein
MGLFIYNTIRASILDRYKENAKDVATVVMEEFYGEVGDKFERISSGNDPEYQEIFDLLSKYQKSRSVDFIYTMKSLGDELIFVVDADPSPDTRAPYGEAYPITENIRPSLHGEICCDKDFATDKWGTYISGYAPIYNSKGIQVGIIGVDKKAAGITRELNVLKLQICLLIASFFTVGVIFLYILWSSFSKKDLLTGIMNYDSLVDKGESIKKKGALSSYSLIQLNIRNFKAINSKIGTTLGDVLLIQYAGIISSNLESSEYCARTGSDNFILLIKKGHEDDLIETLSETWINLSSYGITELIQISIRCGIYEIDRDDSMQDSINYTSIALKHARLSNKNFIIKFEKSMLESMVESNRIITDFQRALDEGEFQVFYQPKVNISTNELCGAEALIRWIKDGNIIPPGEFVPILEAEGLIPKIDFFVFETVCQNICEWEIKDLKPVPVSSNFSKLNLANPNFADSILSIMKKYDIDPSLLEIELTESSGYSDYEALIVFVEKMNRAKIHTSIDDFGTGYSSLSLLKDINVDVVKIDKSFLAKTSSDDEQQEKMLGNVIQMISDLGRTVICEGIENEEQLEFLKSASCKVVQGFLFDKPLSHDEFEMRLRSPHYSIDATGKVTVETPEVEERWEKVDLVEKPKDETVIMKKDEPSEDEEIIETEAKAESPKSEPEIQDKPVGSEPDRKAKTAPTKEEIREKALEKKKADKRKKSNKK